MYHACMIATAAQASLTEVNRRAFGARTLFETLGDGALPEYEGLSSRITVRRVEARGTVFTQDAEHPFVYVVTSGLLKIVYSRADGEEWIKSFVREGQFFASIAALRPGGRTSFSVVAVEPCELEKVPFVFLQSLADRHIAWARVIQSALMIFAERKERRERELLTLKPEERYRAFLADTHGLQPRIPQKDLARYLGLTPVGLNRIVKRVGRD